ncbi:hypothetical protein ACFCY8_38590 [Streptomyces noursei]|uniref:hypothetical protein n=1 Tax=Streptomyces noursei TaxID=1971 RepID=UPI0035DDE139
MLVEYQLYTGGTALAPVGVGDRLMRSGIASGHWPIVEVTAVESTPDGAVVTVREKNWPPYRCPGREAARWFFKLDRNPGA